MIDVVLKKMDTEESKFHLLIECVTFKSVRQHDSLSQLCHQNSDIFLFLDFFFLVSFS